MHTTCFQMPNVDKSTMCSIRPGPTDRQTQTLPMDSSPSSRACSVEEQQQTGACPVEGPNLTLTASLLTFLMRCAVIRLRCCHQITNHDSTQLLRPEVERRVPWWTWFGAICGAGIGFIIANFPGLMLGAVAGNRLGAVRDAKGKSVAAVFNDLGGNQKAEVSNFNLHYASCVLNKDV